MKRKLRSIRARLNRAGVAYNRQGVTAAEQTKILAYGNKMLALGENVAKRAAKKKERSERAESERRAAQRSAAERATVLASLVGRTVTGLRVSDDQALLVFDSDRESFAYEAYGDCCSESWFADITGVSALLGGRVRDVQEIEMGGYSVNDGRCRQDKDEAYGFKLKTNKGYADIVFRNSSNGYYGGYLKPFLGRLPDNLASITDDWSA